MSKKISIAIDAMGGENSPFKTIEGVKIFLDKNKNKNDFIFNLFGDEEKIISELKKLKINNDSIVINHTNSVVSDDETPLTAIKNSKNTRDFNNKTN